MSDSLPKPRILTVFTVVRTEAASVQKHYSPGEYGIHRAATLGDLRKRVRDLATLLNFEFMEEDRANQ